MVCSTGLLYVSTVDVFKPCVAAYSATRLQPNSFVDLRGVCMILCKDTLGLTNESNSVDGYSQLGVDHSDGHGHSRIYVLLPLQKQVRVRTVRRPLNDIYIARPLCLTASVPGQTLNCPRWCSTHSARGLLPGLSRSSSNKKRKLTDVI